MQPITAATKAKATSITKATVRGPGATAAWGYVIWVLLVDKNHVLVPKGGVPDSFTNIEVGLIAVVWCGILRALEAKWAWFGTLLLSAGPPSYSPIGTSDQPTITANVDSDGSAQVSITPAPAADPDAAPATGVAVVVPPADGPPLFSPGEPEVPEAVTLDPATLPPPYIPPPEPVTALDDPESLDTSATFISTDPDDLLEGH